MRRPWRSLASTGAALAVTLPVWAWGGAAPARASDFPENPPPYILEWGGSGHGPGQFFSPEDLAADRLGDVFVADTFTSRIQEFDVNGTFLRTWGEEGSGDGQFVEPLGVAADAAGNVYVLDGDGHGRVQRFTAGGTFVSSWDSGGDRGIAADGTRVYVTDPVGGRVLVFAPDGTPLTSIATEDPGGPQGPDEVAIGPGGKICVLGLDRHVRTFTPDGTPLSDWNVAGPGGSEPDDPAALSVDPAGNVFVTDVNNDRIEKFTSDGTFLTAWGTYGHDGPGRFFDPAGVAVDAQGNVFVADDIDDRVQRFGLVAQPDARIRLGSVGADAGDGVYNDAGLDQTLIESAPPGATLSYSITIEDDAPIPDEIVVRGTGSNGSFTVRYLAGADDVTAAVVAGTYRTAVLSPQEAATLVAVVHVSDETPRGASFDARLSAKSTADASRGDTVGFLTRTCTGRCHPPSTRPAPVVYVTSSDPDPDTGTGYVDSIDTSTNVLGDRATVGFLPVGIAITPDGATAYVALFGEEAVQPIDLATGALGPPVAVGRGPWSVAVTPDGKTVLVDNADDGSVTFIDTATDEADAPIQVGHGPFGLAVSPDGATAYVAVDDGVVPIDLATRHTRPVIPVVDARDIAITPDGGLALVTSDQGLVPIDLGTNTAEPPVPIGVTSGVAVTADGTTAYVTDLFDDRVTPVDLSTMTSGAPIAVHGAPGELVITPDGSTAYVAVSTFTDRDQVVPIDLSDDSVGTPIPVSGTNPFGIAIAPAPAGPTEPPPPPAARPVVVTPTFTG